MSVLVRIGSEALGRRPRWVRSREFARVWKVEAELRSCARSSATHVRVGRKVEKIVFA